MVTRCGPGWGRAAERALIFLLEVPRRLLVVVVRIVVVDVVEVEACWEGNTEPDTTLWKDLAAVGGGLVGS